MPNPRRPAVLFGLIASLCAVVLTIVSTFWLSRVKPDLTPSQKQLAEFANEIQNKNKEVERLKADRNANDVKLKFFVFGQFDIRQAGKPNNEDAEVIRTLIRQYGATSTDVLNADVDFVVIGPEPKPGIAREAYDQTLERARALTIPVMSQERFLDFVGYAHLARQR